MTPNDLMLQEGGALDPGRLSHLAVSNGWLLLGHKLLCCLCTCLGAQVLNLGFSKDDVGV